LSPTFVLYIEFADGTKTAVTITIIPRVRMTTPDTQAGLQTALMEGWRLRGMPVGVRHQRECLPFIIWRFHFPDERRILTWYYELSGRPEEDSVSSFKASAQHGI